MSGCDPQGRGVDQGDVLDSGRLSGDEHAHIWREPRYDGLECLNARFRRHAYVPHTHETYVLGVLTGGVEVFRYRGVEHRAVAGHIALLDPDEVHDGRPDGEGFAYRMFYPSVALVRRELAEAFGRPVPAPVFRDAVVDDPALFAALNGLHAALERPGCPALASDVALAACFAAAARRHGALTAEAPRAGREPAAIRRARDYLDANLAENVALEDLATAAGLSRYHLVRSFRAALGITPHAYLVDRRVRLAKRLLVGGEPLAGVAAACGFFDQAHFTRVFKGRTGVTPGQYRRGSNGVQDRLA